MSTDTFSFKASSLSPVDRMPPEDCDDEDHNDRWREYCRVASTIDRARILQVVLSDSDAEDSPLYDLIDSALQSPHEPGRPRESITVLAGIGKAIMYLVAKAVDDQVSLRMGVEVPRD